MRCAGYEAERTGTALKCHTGWLVASAEFAPVDGNVEDASVSVDALALRVGADGEDVQGG